MTHEADRDEFEDVLRRFQPVGPPADLRARALTAPPRVSLLSGGRLIFIGGVVAAATAGVVIWSGRPPAENSQAARPLPGYSESSMRFSPLTLDERLTFSAMWGKEPRVDLGVPADGASVVLVEFMDWLSAASWDAHRMNRSVVDESRRTGPRMKYVVTDWPLNTECNASITTTVSPASCTAAAFVRTAERRGRADAMTDWLFANQSRIASLGAGEAVAAVKAGAAAVLGPIDLDREYADRVADLRLATAPGRGVALTSAPATFVNGVRLPSWANPAHLDFAIRIEMGIAGTRGSGALRRPETGDGFGGAGGGGYGGRPFGAGGRQRGGGRGGPR